MRSAYDTVQAIWRHWVDDPAGSMRHCAPDVVYTLNVSPDTLEIGGKTEGRDALTARMVGLRDVFDYLVFIPRVMAVEGDVVRASIEIILRHKPSGELLTGTIRNIMTVRDGLIVRVDEYVDAPMIEAFMRLVSSGQRDVAEQPAAPEPANADLKKTYPAEKPFGS